MKTIPEIIERKIRLMFIKKYKWQQNFNDWMCYIFDHKWKYLSDIMGNNQGDHVCKRCNRYKTNGGFYHNWEMDWGNLARCHNHSNINKL